MGKPVAPPSLKWTGTKGNDTANVQSRDALAHTTYDGAGGFDTLNLSGISDAGVSLSINLNNPGTSRLWAESEFSGSWWNYSASGPVVNNTIKNFEKVIGTNFNDYIDLAGGSVARVVDGGPGDDAIYMGSSTGTNTAIGGLDHDQLFGVRNTDVLIGGTYTGSAILRDNVSDEFTMYSGTILDFVPNVDKLYIDATKLPGQVTNASWQPVMTSYGAGARLTIAADQIITVVGVDAATMSGMATGYVQIPVGGQYTSGAGDDLIAAANSTSADNFIFPAGSGDDVLVGFQADRDVLVFVDTPTWSQIDYHGEQTLLATYDGGASTVLLIGLTLDDVPDLSIGL